MPAHAAVEDVGVRCKADGTVLTEIDRDMNDYVDKLAKEAAGRDQVTTEARSPTQLAVL